MFQNLTLLYSLLCFFNLFLQELPALKESIEGHGRGAQRVLRAWVLSRTDRPWV